MLKLLTFIFISIAALLAQANSEESRLLTLPYNLPHYSNFLKPQKPNAKNHRFFQYEVPSDGIIIDAYVGTPPQPLSFRVETGTTHTWIVPKGYKGKTPNVYDAENSTTAVPIGNEFVEMSGNLQLFGGDLADVFNDTKSAFNASLAIILDAEVYIPYITQVDSPDLPFGGILGIGWDFDQNKKQAGEDGASFVANWMGKVKQRVYALTYGRNFDQDHKQFFGSFGFELGGTSNVCKNDITYFDLLGKDQANLPMSFKVDKFQNGNYEKVLNKATGRFDSGSSLIYVPDKVLDALSQLIPFDLDQKTGLFMIDCDEAKKQKDLVFTVNGKEFNLPAEQYIVDLGSPDKRCVLMLGDSNEMNVDFIFGLSFLQQFCSVYNLDTNQVGLATPLSDD